MSERYTKLFELGKNLYAKGAPVIISAGNLLKDNKTGGILVQLKIKNIAGKSIKAAIVNILSKDVVGNPIEGETRQEYLDLYVRQGEEFGQKTAIALPSSSARSFSAEVDMVVFEDNSVWESRDSVWEALPTPSNLKSLLADDELLRQYRLRFGSNCEAWPQEHKDLWLCSCGTWNKDETCYSCKNNKSELLTADIDEMKSERNKRLAREKAEQEAKEAARIEAETQARLASEERAKRIKKTAAIITPIVIACIAFLIILTNIIIPNNTEKLAVRKYQTLLEEFEKHDGRDEVIAITDYLNENDCPEAVFDALLKDAASGDPYAEYLVAYCYTEECTGYRSNADNAYQWAKKSADQGNGYGMNILANCYMNGRGVDKDEAKGIALYEKAAEQGNYLAAGNLGYYYLNGIAVDQNYAKALELYTTAANSGWPSALTNLGQVYYLGYGNFNMARQCWEKAANANDPYALHNLGVLYLKGDGVTKDENKAQEYFQKATEAGFSG